VKSRLSELFGHPPGLSARRKLCLESYAPALDKSRRPRQVDISAIYATFPSTRMAFRVEEATIESAGVPCLCPPFPASCPVRFTVTES
jgi:hypothetical protein